MINALKIKINKIFNFNINNVNIFTFLSILIICIFGYVLQTQVILDDTYIYFRVVHNVLSGLGPRFNPGDQNMIATSTGWLWVLVAAQWMLPKVALPLLAKTIFIGLLAVTSVLLFELLRKPFPIVAALCPIAVYCAPTLIVVDGHDTALTLCANVAMILAYTRKSRWLPVLVVIAYFARGESIIFGSILVAITVFRRSDSSFNLATRIKRLLPATIIAGLLLIVWHGYYWAEFRHISPSSFRVKILQGHNGWPTFASAWDQHLSLFLGDHHFWAYAFLLSGAVIIIAKLWPVIAWPVLHFLIYALLGVALADWYYYPIELVIGLAALVASVSAAGVVIDGLSPLLRFMPIRLTYPLHLLIALGFCAILPLGGAFIQNTAIIKQALVSGHWQAHQYDARFESYKATVDAIKTDATANKTPTILAAEIGIFGYLMPSSPVYDVVGLTDPRVGAKDLWDWKNYIARLSPDYLVGPPEGNAAVLLQGDNYYKFIYRPKDPPGFGVFKKTNIAASDGELGVLRQVQITPTSGPKPAVDIEGDHLILFAHAPSIVSTEIPAGAHRLHVVFGFRDSAWHVGTPEPARFLVRIVDQEGNFQDLWQRVLGPTTLISDRGPQEASIDIPANVPGKLVLSILPVGSPNWLWTYWSTLNFR